MANITKTTSYYNTTSGPSEVSKSETPDYYFLNKKFLLEIIMKQCGIEENDLYDDSMVKQKVRDSKLGELLK